MNLCLTDASITSICHFDGLCKPPHQRTSNSRYQPISYQNSAWQHSFKTNMPCAGQALIQFAKRSRQREEFAIKFFLSRADYDAEVALYSTDCLGTFLPTIHARVDNLDGSLCDANGNPLPPCIVMEQGESLYDRINITLPDKSGICGVRNSSHECFPVQIPSELLTYLAALHRGCTGLVTSWAEYMCFMHVGGCLASISNHLCQ